MAVAVVTLLLAATAVMAENLPPSCDRPVYCNSDLLHHVQLKRVYNDSKTFVDMRLIKSEETTLEDFDTLLNNTGGDPTRDELIQFIDEYFKDGDELDEWTPTDLNDEPPFLEGVKDETYKQFGRDVNKIWASLGRKVSDKVTQNPELFSLIPLPHGFIIPGGRFKEIYYWDSYWIIEGLITCGMTDTARGMIENLIELVRKLGHVPNGSRVYYNERSQPPLLTAMAKLYMKATNDRQWLRQNIDVLEQELMYWLQKQTVRVRGHTLLQYRAPSDGPRPESYREDYENAQAYFNGSEERRRDFYIDMKSAAESGWDFSSRWFVDAQGNNSGGLENVRTRRLVPVDLNAIYAAALDTIGQFRARLRNPLAAAKWWFTAARWRRAIDSVLWSEEDGVWFDYDLELDRHRKYFYPSNVSPLWAGAVDARLVKLKAPRVVRYLVSSQALDWPGGVPTSQSTTGEQWDFPNAWPPLQSIMIGALDATGDAEGRRLAVRLANAWMRSNYAAFNQTQIMFEKYDAVQPGAAGDGGEYEVQAGFGWSNGVVFELLGKYGQELTLTDSSDAPSVRSGAGLRSHVPIDKAADPPVDSYIEFPDDFSTEWSSDNLNNV